MTNATICSKFQGYINEIPNISVDHFLNLKSRAFFLSHCHADHMVGLNSPLLFQYLHNNPDVNIYCSPVTRNILEKWSSFSSLTSCFRTLEVNQSLEVQIVDKQNDQPKSKLFVTLIPAGHCPGSIMFLFEGSFGTVLYTGDFRIATGDSRKLKAFKSNPNCPEYGFKRIDHLYLDCTFCYSKAKNLPDRNECMELIFNLVKEWICQGPEYKIFLSLAARFGSEFLFVELFKKFGLKVHVSQFKYQIYQKIPEVAKAVTLNSWETSIHACSDNNKCFKDIPCMPKNGPHKIRPIRPTTQWHMNKTSNNGHHTAIQEDGIYRVLFSMHSSLEEIQDLVNTLKPLKITPIAKPDVVTYPEIQDLLKHPVEAPSIAPGEQERRDPFSFLHMKSKFKKRIVNKRCLPVKTQSEVGGAKRTYESKLMSSSVTEIHNQKATTDDQILTIKSRTDFPTLMPRVSPVNVEIQISKDTVDEITSCELEPEITIKPATSSEMNVTELKKDEVTCLDVIESSLPLEEAMITSQAISSSPILDLHPVKDREEIIPVFDLPQKEMEKVTETPVESDEEETQPLSPILFQTDNADRKIVFGFHRRRIFTIDDDDDEAHNIPTGKETPKSAKNVIPVITID